MKKRNYIVAGIVIIIIVGLGIFYMSTKSTTFKEAVLDQFDVKEVSSIEIIKSGENEKVVTVTDSSEIEKILNTFSQTKLRESSLSNINYADSYWMTIKTNNKNRKFGITLYDKDYINIYEYSAAIQKNTTKSYKITNDFDPIVIRDLFK